MGSAGYAAGALAVTGDAVRVGSKGATDDVLGATPIAEATGTVELEAVRTGADAEEPPTTRPAIC